MAGKINLSSLILTKEQRISTIKYLFVFSIIAAIWYLVLTRYAGGTNALVILDGLDPYNWKIYFNAWLSLPLLFFVGLAICCLDRLFEDFSTRHFYSGRPIVNPHVIGMIGVIAIIAVLVIAIRLIYLPLAGRIKGTVQVNITPESNQVQGLSFQARLVPKKSGYEYRGTELKSDELILTLGINYEVSCMFIGPDGKQVQDYSPNWRLNGNTDAVSMSQVAPDRVTIRPLKEGYLYIVIEDKDEKAIFECRVK